MCVCAVCRRETSNIGVAEGTFTRRFVFALALSRSPRRSHAFRSPVMSTARSLLVSDGELKRPCTLRVGPAPCTYTVTSASAAGNRKADALNVCRKCTRYCALHRAEALPEWREVVKRLKSRWDGDKSRCNGKKSTVFHKNTASFSPDRTDMTPRLNNT